jgi:prefoldin subunit 5
MTNEGWKVFGELMEILKDRFDDQEKRIKYLEKQIELLTEDEKWIPEQMQGVREAE